jgi:hypothetical protein
LNLVMKKRGVRGDSRMREAAEAELGASFTETSSKIIWGQFCH